MIRTAYPVLILFLDFVQSPAQAKYFLLTDGRRWEVYNFAGIDRTKPEIRLDLLEDTISEVCLKALALWRPSAKEGRLLAGQTPLVPVATEPISVEPSAQSPEIVQVEEIHRLSSDNYDWKSIANLGSVSGKQAPAELLLPHGLAVQMSSWKSVMIEAFRCLLSTKNLTNKDVPLQLTKGHRYLLAASPFHKNGKPMRSYIELPPYYVETHFSAKDILRLTILAIQHAGQDPSAFKVRFS